MGEELLTVTLLTKRIRSIINRANPLKNVYVKGEVSKVKYYPNGNIYLDLKDEESVINGVIYPLVSRKLDFKIEKGMNLILKGTVEVYARNKSSRYHLKINKVDREGVGNLHAEYMKLRKKLAKMGYFDESIKKPIPKFPERIGVVTSPVGEAIKDILKKVETRWPLCEVILFPSLVQGEKAKYEIARQIKRSENFNLDVLIVGRGGGSPEDLWAFNEEIVAKAIYECPIPVISAVGHQDDFSISDDVADLRALTPTDAGEKVVPDLFETKNKIRELEFRLNSRIKHNLDFNKKRFENVLRRPTLTSPSSIYEEEGLKLAMLKSKLSSSSNELILTNRRHLDVLKSSFIFKDPSKLSESKSRRYSQLVDKLGINSRNFIVDKGRGLERLKESYILNNPGVLFEDKLQEFNNVKKDLEYYSNDFILNKERQLDKYKDSYILNNPDVIIKEKSRDYEDILRDLHYSSDKLLKSKEDDLKDIKNSYIIKNPDKLLIYEKNAVGGYMEKLSVLNPLNTLKRGYSITKHDDKVISSKKDLEIGDELEINFDDGSVNTKVVDLK